MVKKSDKPADDEAQAFPRRSDSHMADAVRESAQQIWLAGMGAFAKAQQEGNKVFETLVKEGAGLQKRTQAAAEERFGEVAGKMSAMANKVANEVANEVTSKAGASWDKLESIFETRTAKAMERLGVPTSKDVAALNQRVDDLAAAVARLTKGASEATARATGAASRKAASASTRAGSAQRRAPRNSSKPQG